MFKQPAPLIQDRTPFLLMERCQISSRQNAVVAKKENQIINIPVRSTQLLILGNGTSITSEAMYLCAKERCGIAQSKGGISIHTVMHSGLYPSPTRITKQILRANGPERIKLAKYIAIKKLQSLSVNTEKEIEQIKAAPSLEIILGIEGAITKKEYKAIFGQNFSRQSEDLINKNINVINSILYSFVASVVCSLGYSPSVGFLHGHTRRGGLVFDIADIFKHRLYMYNIQLLQSDRNMARELSDLMHVNKKKVVKEIIEEIEIICGGVE